jgi:hypothetical protein
MITLTRKPTVTKFRALNLVQSKVYKDVVVLVTQDFRSICLPHQFMGVYLKHSDKSVIGEVAKLDRKNFELFNGTTTITN